MISSALPLVAFFPDTTLLFITLLHADAFDYFDADAASFSMLMLLRFFAIFFRRR